MLPILAALINAGLPILAGAVASKGKDFIQEKLGINLDDALGTEEGRLRLKQAEFTHEEFLLNNALEERKLSSEETAMFLRDTGDARAREAAIAVSAEAPFISKAITPILAIGVLTLTLGICCVLLFTNTEIPGGRKEIMIYILGFLSSIATQIVAYYFGSSKSSATKDATIAAMQGAKL